MNMFKNILKTFIVVVLILLVKVADAPAAPICTAPEAWDGNTMVSGSEYCTTPETCGCGTHSSTQLYRKAPSNTGYGGVGTDTICCYQSQINSDDHCCNVGQHWNGSSCVENCIDVDGSNKIKGFFGQPEYCAGGCMDLASGLWGDPGEEVKNGICGCKAGYRGRTSKAYDIPICAPCDPGEFRSGWTSTETECLDCPLGYYSSDYGSSSCSACPAGTYSPNKGISIYSCYTCPVNTYSSSGSASCTSCPSGKEAPAGSTSSSACGCPSNKPLWTGSACVACATGEVYSSGSCWKVSDKDLTCFEKGDGTCKFADTVLQSGSLGVLYRIIQ